MDQVPKEKCEFCGKEFDLDAELNSHIKKEHPQEYQQLSSQQAM